MLNNEELVGIVDRVIFRNIENGFTIFVMQNKYHKDAIIKGHLPSLQPGEQITVRGAWTVHPKFGKQFEAQSCTSSLPTTLVGITKYLSSGMIKGIGPVYAEKLVKAFGANVLEIIDKHPYRLHEIHGIGKKRVEHIIAAWQDQKEISHIMVFLQEKNISPAYATKIYKHYKGRSLEVLQENPYRLADEVWGIGFKTADQIAQNMGFEHDSLKRIIAGILYALSSLSTMGHLYSEIEALKQRTRILLGLSEADSTIHTLTLALSELTEHNRIKCIIHENKQYLALATHYHAEKGIAQTIKKLMESSLKHVFNIDAIYHQLRTMTGRILLHEDQQRGILTCLQSKVTIITGGPGTGKTTLIKQLLAILEQNHSVYKLAAPTGRAARRITEGTGRHAATIHRLLEFDRASMRFKHDEQHALPLDFLIVDEASMIDVFLAYALFKAIPHHAHVILIGDIDQLPPVGAGNVLHDLIKSAIIPTIRLTAIFRQAHDSLITVNAHRINHGEFPISHQENSRRDFLFIKENDPELVPEHLRLIYTNQLQRFNIPHAESIVLVPMNRGSVGTQRLNCELQKLLNPEETDKQIQYMGTIFKLRDRVMQIRNNYDKFVFNGDTGIIENINSIERVMLVQFPDQLIEYDFNELDELILAYSISIHKSQGSEFNAVIILLFMQHFTLLQRNLLYTAITRAKKLCIFIGQTKAVAIALKNNKGIDRITFLSNYLTSALSCQ